MAVIFVFLTSFLISFNCFAGEKTCLELFQKPDQKPDKNADKKVDKKIDPKTDNKTDHKNKSANDEPSATTPEQLRVAVESAIQNDNPNWDTMPAKDQLAYLGKLNADLQSLFHGPESSVQFSLARVQEGVAINRSYEQMLTDPLFKKGLAQGTANPQLLRDYDDVLMMVSRAGPSTQNEFRDKVKRLSKMDQGSKLSQGSNLDSWIQKLAAKVRKMVEEKKCGTGKGRR